MERDLKIVFGKLLGEIYRMQLYVEDFRNPKDEHVIYALRNGFESVIDDEIEEVGFVSKEQHEALVDVLNEIDQSAEKTAAFTGFYDIENKLADRDVDRVTAIRLLRYLKANGQFVDLIAKMDSSNSPSECRTFDLKYNA